MSKLVIGKPIDSEYWLSFLDVWSMTRLLKNLFAVLLRWCGCQWVSQFDTDISRVNFCSQALLETCSQSQVHGSGHTQYLCYSSFRDGMECWRNVLVSDAIWWFSLNRADDMSTARSRLQGVRQRKIVVRSSPSFLKAADTFHCTQTANQVMLTVSGL